MTATLGTPEATTRRQPTTLCVLVGAAVVVGWVLYRHYLVPHVVERVFSWHTLGRWLSVAEVIQSLILTVPYALALLLWGRGLARGLAGAVVAIVAGVYVAGLTYVFERYVFAQHSELFGRSALKVFTWLDLLVVSVLIPLAWGIARRRGWAWPVGLLVGPAVAAALYELQQHWSWWQRNVVFSQHQWSWMLQAVVFVAPFVLAVLACWTLEERGRRTPEIGSSA